jgi:hypothetical protein
MNGKVFSTLITMEIGKNVIRNLGMGVIHNFGHRDDVMVML